MSKNLIVGIDPGSKGAVAFLDLQSEKATVMDMPRDEDALVDILGRFKDRIGLVAIERQQSFPKQGVRSTFSLARHYGILLGILKALKLPYEEVSPRQWQKRILGNGKRTREQSKRRSLERARALFPDVALDGKHGRSDALLIAEWARRERYPYCLEGKANAK